MKKVAIYCRVSTVDQSLDVQRDECVAYCKRQGWEYDIFEEKISGVKSNRPVFDKLMKGVREGHYFTVMVWKLDRLGRSAKHLTDCVFEFQNRGVNFICITQGINTNDAMGRFFLNVMSAVAELEMEFIRERTKKRLVSLKEKGVRLGRPPGKKDGKVRRKSGYYLRWDKENKK